MSTYTYTYMEKLLTPSIFSNFWFHSKWRFDRILKPLQVASKQSFTWVSLTMCREENRKRTRYYVQNERFWLQMSAWARNYKHTSYLNLSFTIIELRELAWAENSFWALKGRKIRSSKFLQLPISPKDIIVGPTVILRTRAKVEYYFFSNARRM